MSIDLRRVFVAVWSPSNAAGDLIEEHLRTHMRWMRNRGITAFMALGSTGEFPHLSIEARKRALQIIVEESGGNPVLANISDIRPAASMELGRHARQVGAAAAAILPPYFYRLADDDLLEFFVQTGKAAGLPIVLYNFPERTGNLISERVLRQAADLLPLAGIKQSGSDFNYISTLAAVGREKKFQVVAGADSRLPEAVKLGAVGAVSGLANAVPELVLASLQDAHAGVMPSEPTLRLKEIGRKLEPLSFPADVRALMQARGLPVGASKALLSSTTQALVEQTTKDLARLLQTWGY